MKVETFFEQFDQFIKAPDSVARLRELILELGVQGRLVPQDAHDECARKLLSRIQAETDELISSGQMKRQRSIVTAESPDSHSMVPPGWVLTTLGEVAQKITDGTHQTPNYIPEGVPFISVKDFSGGELDFSSTRFISPDEHAQLYKRCDPRRGDILLGRIGTLGKAVLVDTDIEFSLFVSVALVRFSHKFIEPAFFRLLLNSPRTKLEFDRIKIGGATHTNKLNLGDMQTISVSLPPLAEQKRIVAKVNELMALCDRLEAQQQERAIQHTVLARASLARFADAPTPANLSFLFHPSYDIAPADLRKSVLTLAIQGKLIPQEANDEPASMLLNTIAAEKAALIQERKLKAARLPASGNPPFVLPNGWEWAELADLLALVTDGDHQAPPQSEEGVPFLVIGNLNAGTINFKNCKYVPADYYENLDWGRKPIAGDLLYTVTGSFGIPVPVETEERFCVQRHVAILKRTDSTPRRYLALVLASHFALEYATRIATGIAQKTVPLTGLRRMPIPVPPAREQHRIVSKLEQLMALMDELETQLAESRVKAADLLSAVVAELTRAA